jgi:hypothetical protein
MSLIESVAEWVLGVLPYDRSDPDVVAALKSKHPGELLVLFYNWRTRLIPAHPRHVARSDAFDKNPIVAQRRDVIAAIIRDIEQGNDLTRYLSRRVLTGFELPPSSARKRLNRRPHLDLLLNEWRIHHLHLTTTVEADGFVERDDPLLFAMFMPSEAYLLDIATHDSFADDQLVKIAVSNWPSDQLFLEMKGILGLRSGGRYSSEDRKQLRGAGIASFVQIGDRVFSPPGGISTAGTSSQASIWTNHVLRTLNNFEEQVKKDPSVITGLIRKHGGQPSERPEFEFAVLPTGFGVIEKQSRAFINLSQGAGG